MTEIIFYFGVLIIIGTYVYLIIQRFREEDRIDLKKHFWIIIIYIILIIMSIIVWRVIYLLLTSSTHLMRDYNTNIENLLNG
ncbi:MAG TPA: hypothetical protein EYH54_05905 [Nautiliaceae bacterium]|nr:hypothetical protein [Nautiliaceae bacterium]